MIELKNLTKVYSNSKLEVQAIKNVNLKFKDNGFVFIVGKSGCGKSTLLSLMGGLDSVTQGDIICDGNSLSQMSEKELNNYRNRYLGFVFQDYCLIEDLSVFENVALALDIKGEKLTKADRVKLVHDALSSVELDNSVANRKIKELSGGQRQRVSIARSLVKDPMLILADEPTGNLDSRTSKTILELMKKLSKDRLVVIVSHNMEDAIKYADRIIELSDGVVVSDIERTKEDIYGCEINNGVLTLPISKKLTSEELEEINNELKSNNIKKIVQHSDGFENTKDIESGTKKVKIESESMKFKSTCSLAGKFLKKRVFAGIFTIFSIILLVFMLGMCQFLTQFNSAKTSSKMMLENNETQILAYKGYYDDDLDKNMFGKYIEVGESEIESFRENGYTGNIFKIFHDPYCSTAFTSEGEYRIDDKYNYSNGIYLAETHGTLQCTEEYLVKTFGVDGELEFLAKSGNPKPNGILIPDYVADSVLAIRPDSELSYENIVNHFSCDRKFVNGIFKTDFKEKYADVLEYLIKANIGAATKAEKEAIKARLKEFNKDVRMYYGLAYTTNPNYVEDMKDITGVQHSYSRSLDITIQNKTLSFGNCYFYNYNKITNDELGENEIAIEYDTFNSMFGKEIGQTYTEDNYTEFQPITITLVGTDGTDDRLTRYSKELVIKKLLPTTVMSWTNATHNVMFGSPEVFSFMFEKSLEVTGLMFDDIQQIDKIYDLLEENIFQINSEVYAQIKVVGDIVDIFIDLFGLIVVAVATVCTLLLVNYSYGNIKKRYYEIGVMKALGASTKSVGFIFGLQTILAGVVVCVASTLMLMFLCDPINLQLSNKLLEFIGNSNLGVINIIKPNTITLIINIIAISVISFVSCLIPIRKIHKIKPKNIINKD